MFVKQRLSFPFKKSRYRRLDLFQKIFFQGTNVVAETPDTFGKLFVGHGIFVQMPAKRHFIQLGNGLLLPVLKLALQARSTVPVLPTASVK